MITSRNAIDYVIVHIYFNTMKAFSQSILKKNDVIEFYHLLA